MVPVDVFPKGTQDHHTGKEVGHRKRQLIYSPGAVQITGASHCHAFFLRRAHLDLQLVRLGSPHFETLSHVSLYAHCT